MRKKRNCPNCGNPGGTYGTYCRSCSKLFFPPKRISLIERLKRNTRIVGECWEWKGKVNAYGYGELRIPTGTSHRQYQRAHRISYQIHHPEWSGEGVVMHSCDNRRCWNPDHLSLGSPADNVLDMASKDRCEYGSLHHSAKLSENKVSLIRSSELPVKDLALMYGVSKSAIYQAKRGKTWERVGRC